MPDISLRAEAPNGSIEFADGVVTITSDGEAVAVPVETVQRVELGRVRFGLTVAGRDDPHAVRFPKVQRQEFAAVADAINRALRDVWVNG